MAFWCEGRSTSRSGIWGRKVTEPKLRTHVFHLAELDTLEDVVVRATLQFPWQRQSRHAIEGRSSAPGKPRGAPGRDCRPTAECSGWRHRMRGQDGQTVCGSRGCRVGAHPPPSPCFHQCQHHNTVTPLPPVLWCVGERTAVWATDDDLRTGACHAGRGGDASIPSPRRPGNGTRTRSVERLGRLFGRQSLRFAAP